MPRTFTTREMFRLMFKIARWHYARNPRDAFYIANAAMDDFLRQFMPDWTWDEYERANKAYAAVLRAIHWKTQPRPEWLKLHQSEFRYAIDTIDGDMVVSHPGPRLPG